MFILAAKVAMVEALRDAFDQEYQGKIKFRSIDIEYPEQQPAWPSLLVQFRLTSPVRWTGINPDEIIVTDDGQNWSATSVRFGQFEGAYDLTVLALSSQERDRLWDALFELVLMGRMRSDTEDFWSKINNHDLIHLTAQEDVVNPVGDSIGPGVPWDPDLLAYEATIRIAVTGQFFMDSAQQQLIRFSAIELMPYDDTQEPPGEADGLGAWN